MPQRLNLASALYVNSPLRKPASFSIYFLCLLAAAPTAIAGELKIIEVGLDVRLPPFQERLEAMRFAVSTDSGPTGCGGIPLTGTHNKLQVKKQNKTKNSRVNSLRHACQNEIRINSWDRGLSSETA